MNSIWIDVLDRCILFSMLAIAANLVLGLAGQMSLATAGLFGLGSYASAIVAADHGWGFLPATIFAVLFSALMGGVLALPVLRVRGEYVVLLTLAFLSVANQMEASWIEVTGGATGKFPIPSASIFGYQPLTPWHWVPVLAVTLAVVVVIALLVAESPYGRVLKGIREEPVATRALGINVFRYQLSIFAASGALAGLAGSLWAHYFAFITPRAFDLDQTIFIAAIVVLGGMGNIYGSVLAAFVLVSLPQVLTSLDLGSDHSAEIQQVVYGVLLIVFMSSRPQGLLRERVAQRRRLLGHLGVPEPDGRVDPATTRQFTPAPRVPATDSGDAMLEARGLRKHFGGVRALDDVTLALPSGRITALIGPNGAGKTTLFNVLTGDTRPDEGRVLCRGVDITGLRSDQIAQRGVVRSFQDVRLFMSISALENTAIAIPGQTGSTLRSLFARPFATFGGQRDVNVRAHAALDLVGFDADRNITVSQLSYGEQKLVALARLLATDHDVVLLDEPSAGTDAHWVQRVLEIIRRLADDGKAVCIVEHNLDLIRQLDGTAYFLDEGRILASGSVIELMGERQLLETYLGL